MDKLLSFTPEPFPELDRETEYDELDPLTDEWEMEELEEEARRDRRPRSSAKAPRRSVTKPKMRPRAPSRATGLRVMPFRQRPKLMPRPLPIPALRAVAIPFIPPLRIMRPDLEPAPPRDVQRPEESRRTEQAGSEGSGSPSTAQPAEEPASEHVRWVQECLNRALGLQLTVDGVMNRETRSAVRLFQERRGVPISGLVGPDTEVALQSTCAGASHPATDNVVTPETEPEIPRPTSCVCPAYNRIDTRVIDAELAQEPTLQGGSRGLTVIESQQLLIPEAFAYSEFETLGPELEVVGPPGAGPSSPNYVRWVQNALNQIMGLRLTTDGIMGPSTRSAIRGFQQKLGLMADGTVGPKTEAAIKTASNTGSIPLLSSSPYTIPPFVNSSVSTITPRILAYSTRDVIDERISVPAQYSLVRLSKNPATNAVAMGLVEEVKTGRLAGIYCVNWIMSAQRALSLGTNWWSAIPAGEDAVLMLDPEDLINGQPLIAFRRTLSPDCGLLKDEQRFSAAPARLDAALLQAWKNYLRFRRKEFSCFPVQAGSARQALTQSHQLGKGAPQNVVCPKPSDSLDEPMPVEANETADLKPIKWPVDCEGKKTADDVRARNLLNCPFPATLAAMAHTNRFNSTTLISEQRACVLSVRSRRPPSPYYATLAVTDRFFTITFRTGSRVDVTDLFYVPSMPPRVRATTPDPIYGRATGECLWVSIMEKAYAVLRGGANGYGGISRYKELSETEQIMRDLCGLDYELNILAQEVMLPKYKRKPSFNTTLQQVLNNASRTPTIACTRSESLDLISEHCYAVLGRSRAGAIQIYNPSDGTTRGLTNNEFSDNFAYVLSAPLRTGIVRSQTKTAPQQELHTAGMASGPQASQKQWLATDIGQRRSLPSCAYTNPLSLAQEPIAKVTEKEFSDWFYGCSRCVLGWKVCRQRIVPDDGSCKWIRENIYRCRCK